MRWRSARAKPVDNTVTSDPVVVSVTTTLNRDTALDVAREVERIAPGSPVVVDLTAIPGFDTDGADTLFQMQATHGPSRVSIVGFRQATARIVGADEGPPAVVQQAGWVVRRLRNLVVVQPREPEQPAAAGLEQTLAEAAGGPETAIVVLDLLGLRDLPHSAVDAIAFASSSAALRGQELLVVNVSLDVAEALRAVGLSATTFLAPEPLPEPPPYG